MKDFFEQQNVARRRTWLLLFYFLLAVSAVAGIVAAAVHILFSFDPARLYHAPTPFALSPSSWDFSALASLSGVVLFLILIASLFQYRQLCSGGGSMIAEMLGGRIIFPDTTDPRERRLLNIVEEMALASGVTVPSVYLLASERGINAFSAGYRQEDAVLGVTGGALERLNRDGLQGVIAHEFSHIFNGDMLLNLRLQGLLHGILAISLLGRVMLRMTGSRRHTSGNSRGAHPLQIVLGLLLVTLGYLGVFFGKLIKAAVSRQREFLADAAAVQFTRNPLGLAGALKKIGGLRIGSRLGHPLTQSISHMFFANGLTAGLAALSTHPPLENRIKRLDPAFDGAYPVLQAVEPGEALHEVFPILPQEGLTAAAHANYSGFTASPAPDRDHPRLIAASPEQVIRTMGNPTMEYMRFARQLIDSLPREVLNAARNSFGARAVIYGLLLDSLEEMRTIQLEILKHADPLVWQECGNLIPQLLALPRDTRLPLVDLCLPSLMLLSSGQYRSFRENIDRLAKADHRINLFEYVLHHVVKRHLDGRFEATKKKNFLHGSIPALSNEISCILSLLARLGQNGPTAEETFRKASATIKGHAEPFVFLSPAQCSLKHFDQALRRLGQASFAVRGKVLNACLACVTQDDKITVEEAELLRAIADALGCPVPPWMRMKARG
jgi:Zn-dependent protease with chaperone function